MICNMKPSQVFSSVLDHYCFVYTLLQMHPYLAFKKHFLRHDLQNVKAEKTHGKTMADPQPASCVISTSFKIVTQLE